MSEHKGKVYRLQAKSGEYIFGHYEIFVVVSSKFNYPSFEPGFVTFPSGLAINSSNVEAVEAVEDLPEGAEPLSKPDCVYVKH